MPLFAPELDQRFQVFHELMENKVRRVLLVSTPYDAWIMEKDQPLTERIINEYRGLNLSHPPRITWVSTAGEALAEIQRRRYDLVITMPRVQDMEAEHLGREIKKLQPKLPVLVLSHHRLPDEACPLAAHEDGGINRTFIWNGNTDILLALIKNTEDILNVEHDTYAAGIRVILFVEDSPFYIASLLPILYREVVTQTQAVMGHGLNEEHRLLAMRARPKILLAQTYEEALALYQKYQPYLLGVISDVRFPRNCQLDGDAGVDFLRMVRSERFDVPLLLTSNEPANSQRAAEIPAPFLDKNSPSLHAEMHNFFLEYLGFGDFVFRTPDGREVGRASNLHALERTLATLPDESFIYHCAKNDFSRWLFARTEIELASHVRCISDRDFASIEAHRGHLTDMIRSSRRLRQKGVIVDLDPTDVDPEIEFLKLGQGSLGGKARGLAFFSALLSSVGGLQEKFPTVDIVIPQTLVVTTEIFDQLVSQNHLGFLAKADHPDREIARRFAQAAFPQHAARMLGAYLDQVDHPLAVRSSSLLEDAQFRAYAGLYKTFMLPNDNQDRDCRVEHLISAIKMVFASTYFQNPKQFSRRVGNRTEEEKMAVMIQELVGGRHGEYFYPAVSGVAQSYNYYPFGKQKPTDGIATIALGLGRTVMEGERTLRFAPPYPQLALQTNRVEDILDAAQQYFYALSMTGRCEILSDHDEVTLTKREVFEAADEPPVRLLSSYYDPQDHRLRDSAAGGGYPVLTFRPLLNHNLVPLGEIIAETLALGQEGMGCPVEMEFSLDLPTDPAVRPRFAILQLRPMTAREESRQVEIDDAERARSFLVSDQALGNTVSREMADIVYVDPAAFAKEQTPQIAQEIGQLNRELLAQERKYLLIGPGRWGSADRWLGIPVQWADISAVGAMVEADFTDLRAEPSQGSHFFHNITTLGINYLTVGGSGGKLDWDWVKGLPVVNQTAHVRHARLETPLVLKVDGRVGRAVAYME